MKRYTSMKVSTDVASSTGKTGNICFRIFGFTLILMAFTVGLMGQDSFALLPGGRPEHTGSASKLLPKYEFRAFNYEYEMEKILPELSGDYFFGREVEGKMLLLDNRCINEEQIVPGNPMTRTLIRKPVIYNSVKRIEKHIRRSVKKNQMTVESAGHIMNTVLDVAINLIAADSGAFEQELESLETTDEQIDLFVNRVALVF